MPSAFLLMYHIKVHYTGTITKFITNCLSSFYCCPILTNTVLTSSYPFVSFNILPTFIRNISIS